MGVTRCFLSRYAHIAKHSSYGFVEATSWMDRVRCVPTQVPIQIGKQSQRVWRLKPAVGRRLPTRVTHRRLWVAGRLTSRLVSGARGNLVSPSFLVHAVVVADSIGIGEQSRQVWHV